MPLQRIEYEYSGLKWVFSAETISIIVIELFIIYLSTKKVQKL